MFRLSRNPRLPCPGTTVIPLCGALHTSTAVIRRLRCLTQDALCAIVIEKVFYMEQDSFGSLQGEKVLITGAAGAIGMEIARVVAQAGAKVALIDISPMPSDLYDRFPASPLALQADITSESDCRNVATEVHTRFGAITGLVNNAGVISRTKTEETTLSEWSRILNVNLTGTFLLTKAVLPYLRSCGRGAVVNIASRAAFRPHRNASPAYGASKAGMVYLTRHWALEFARYGIRVNAVLPGPTRTPMFATMSSAEQEAAIESIPLARPAEPAEIAEAVRFLLSTSSQYITGEAIHINGGSYMG